MMGATRVPRSSMAWRSLSWGRAATLIWKLRREMPPRDSLMWRSFVGYGFGVADDEGSGGAAEGFELGAGDWGPAALFADLGEGFGVAGEEVVGGLLVGVGDVAEGVDADFELLGCVACAVAGFAVEVDEGAEAVGFAADDGDHERKAEACRRGRRIRACRLRRARWGAGFGGGAGRCPGR